VLNPERKMVKKNMKTKRRVNFHFCGFQNKETNAHQKADLFHTKKTTIFHEFNTNEPDFIARTGWTDLWKNVKRCAAAHRLSRQNTVKFRITFEIYRRNQCFVQNESSPHSNL
jgi:hypothetical protein